MQGTVSANMGGARVFGESRRRQVGLGVVSKGESGGEVGRIGKGQSVQILRTIREPWAQWGVELGWVQCLSSRHHDLTDLRYGKSIPLLWRKDCRGQNSNREASKETHERPSEVAGEIG